MAGQIAQCLAELVTLDTPPVSVLLGQGSGGPALAMVPADVHSGASDVTSSRDSRLESPSPKIEVSTERAS